MSWRFALRTRWIVRHVAVALLVVVMVVLGLWQLRRLDEKRDIKALIEARQELPAVPVDEVADPVDEQQHRTVTATGRYDDDATFIVENRTFNSASGAWVLTPLVLDDGRAVVVNRGFLGYDERGEISPPPPPPGEVQVDGVLLAGEERGRFGAVDPEDGDRPVLARVDLGQVAEIVPYDVLPAYVQRVSSTPDEVSDGPPELVALGRPEASEGPHLSYAVQWFTFTTIAVVGYALLLRRVARDEAKEEAAAAADRDLDRELAELLDAET